MKKVILGAVAMMVFSGSAFGWELFDTQVYYSKGFTLYHIRCDDGRNTIVQHTHRFESYAYHITDRGMFNSYGEAASGFCGE